MKRASQKSIDRILSTADASGKTPQEVSKSIQPYIKRVDEATKQIESNRAMRYTRAKNTIANRSISIAKEASAKYGPASRAPLRISSEPQQVVTPRRTLARAAGSENAGMGLTLKPRPTVQGTKNAELKYRMGEASGRIATEGKLGRLGKMPKGIGGAGEALGAVGSVLGVVADLKEARKTRSIGPRNEVISGPLGPGNISRDFGAKRKRKA